MRIASIASSSTGNCIYVGNNNTHILIDAGVSARNIEDGLHKLDVSLDDIDALLVTHEHSDHIKGLGVLERKRTIPIYSANETIEYIKGVKSLGDYDFDCFKGWNSCSYVLGSFAHVAHRCCICLCRRRRRLFCSGSS